MHGVIAKLLWGVMLGLAASLGAARPALAQQGRCAGPARQVELACQSWTEIASALKSGTRTVIVPVGGTEQSGPYIAVGKHNVRVRFLADDIARRAGHVLVAPVVAYVPEGGVAPRTSHMRFPGTISIPVPAFEGLLSGAAESFRAQGFRTVVLLGDHGGYQQSLERVAQRLNRAWKGRGHVLFIPSYYRVVATHYAAFLRSQGYGAAIGRHADLSDTSLTLAVDPSLVRQEALHHAPKPGPEDGVYGGDPRPATSALGQAGVEMQIEAAVEVIMSFNRSHL